MRLNSTNTAIIKRLLGGHNNRPLRSILIKLEPADISKLFNILNEREVSVLIESLISIDKISETLSALPITQLVVHLRKIPANRLQQILNTCPERDAIYFLEALEGDQKEVFISKIAEPRKSRLVQLMSYPEDSAGQDMETKVFTLSVELTAQEAIDAIREKIEEISIYYIYCVDNDGRLDGVLSLRTLVTAPANTPLEKLIKRDPITVYPETPSQEVAQLVAHYDFIAVPVVNENRKLIGIVTVDDVVDIIQEQATADIYATAGLQEDDRVYSSPKSSIKNRLPWMLLNLMLAAFVSSIVALFEKTMSQLIILATLNNIVAGIGGNTAIQTLTVITRGLSTGDFNFISKKKALINQTIIGMTLGVCTGLAAALLVFVWKGSWKVGIVICISMMLNSIVASFVGATVPLFLRKLNWDPASGSSVIVTTVTDSFGFFSFLGIATLALKYIGAL